MKRFLTLLFVFGTFTFFGQNWRGIYKKKSCFCDNHSNSTGWYLGAGVYGSQLSFQNSIIDSKGLAKGYGVFVGNKIKEKVSLRLGVYLGDVLPINIGEGNRLNPYVTYQFKHLNIPLSLVYKFRSEKRISPYLMIGGEANVLRLTTESSDYYSSLLSERKGYNQLNIFLGTGTYLLFGDHFGLFFQVAIDMNPFQNEFLSNYTYGFTGETGITYHF